MNKETKNGEVINETKTSKRASIIIEAGRALFWKHGFKRVSVEEICQNAGISKMTFYRFFSNKTELAKAIFQKEVNKGLQDFRNILNEDTTTPAEKIRKMIMLKIEGVHDISNEFLMDFYKNPELGLKDFIESETARVWQEIILDYKIAQQKGIFRADFKPELMFALSQKMAEIVTDKNLISLYNNAEEMLIDLTNLIIYGITGATKDA